jgi:hypothetical protein
LSAPINADGETIDAVGGEPPCTADTYRLEQPLGL